MRLIPKTHKGRNKIREAGTDEWIIVRSSDSVICLGGAAGHLIAPVAEHATDIRKIRWILQRNDPDFDLTISN
jgi:hypothetical protein